MGLWRDYLFTWASLFSILTFFELQNSKGRVPWRPSARVWCSPCWGPGLISDQGAEILQAVCQPTSEQLILDRKVLSRLWHCYFSLLRYLRIRDMLCIYRNVHNKTHALTYCEYSQNCLPFQTFLPILELAPQWSTIFKNITTTPLARTPAPPRPYFVRTWRWQEKWPHLASGPQGRPALCSMWARSTRNTFQSSLPQTVSVYFKNQKTDLGGVQVLAIVDSAAVNTGRHVSFWITVHQQRNGWGRCRADMWKNISQP